jgi:hypothetical protein
MNLAKEEAIGVKMISRWGPARIPSNDLPRGRGFVYPMDSEPVCCG